MTASELVPRPVADGQPALLTLPGIVTETSLTLPEGLAFEEWQAIGEQVKRVERAASFWLGDWWNYGERHYGEAAYQAAELGIASQTLRNVSHVCAAVESYRRRYNVPFGQHAEVAALPPDAQEKILDLAEENGLTVRETRAIVRLEKARLRYGDPVPVAPVGEATAGRYRVIYADPPWAYDNSVPLYLGEQADHYGLMSVADIAAMPVRDIVEADAVLFLWVTSPILAEAFEVVDAWGFAYKTSFVWDKVKHNMGHYNSVRHELLLVCTRGSCQPDVQTLYDSVVTEERTEHSRKPAVFRSMIDALYPYGRRIELFARERVEGWECYGNHFLS